MKGCPPAGVTIPVVNTDQGDSHGIDVEGMLHRVGLPQKLQLSHGPGRQSQVVFRRRLDHRDRGLLRQALSSWPARTPVILEGTFGWGWMSDELRDANLDPHLCSGRKVAGWREARGLAKSNKRDADLISELWFQQPRWWEVWCAGPQVRDMREARHAGGATCGSCFATEWAWWGCRRC